MSDLNDDYRVQTAFLRSAKENQNPINIYLANGVKLTGKVVDFDLGSILFTTSTTVKDKLPQLVFKVNIATMVPAE